MLHTVLTSNNACDHVVVCDDNNKVLAAIELGAEPLRDYLCDTDADDWDCAHGCSLDDDSSVSDYGEELGRDGQCPAHYLSRLLGREIGEGVPVLGGLSDLTVWTLNNGATVVISGPDVTICRPVTHRAVIQKTTTFDDLAELGDPLCPGTDPVLNGYQVEFDVQATNRCGEVKNFHLAYQSTDRNERLKAYSGYEMSVARDYGCDVDESPELQEFMDHEEGTLDTTDVVAEALSKALYERLLKEHRAPCNEPPTNNQGARVTVKGMSATLAPGKAASFFGPSLELKFESLDDRNTAFRLLEAAGHTLACGGTGYGSGWTLYGKPDAVKRAIAAVTTDDEN